MIAFGPGIFDNISRTNSKWILLCAYKFTISLFTIYLLCKRDLWNMIKINKQLITLKRLLLFTDSIIKKWSTETILIFVFRFKIYEEHYLEKSKGSLGFTKGPFKSYLTLFWTPHVEFYSQKWMFWWFWWLKWISISEHEN